MRRVLFVVMLLFGVALPGAAQTPNRPMVMPAAGAPGPGSWMFGQAYGNTTGAYNFGDQWYRAGQGLHFGIDLSMPCGTPLVAVADGVVQFVDDRGFGSLPHNLILKHEALGVTTLYGHLLRTPSVMPGQFVAQGDIIALSGDPDETCDSRPHLHFEVRSLDYSRTVNPAALIDAQWHTLALVGPYSFPLFQQDLQNPRRWMDMADQPDVTFWGQILNNYTTTAPASSNRRPAPNAPMPRTLPDLVPGTSYAARQLTTGGCCPSPSWDAMNPTRFFLADGQPGSVAGVYAWDVTAPDAGGTLTGPAPVPHTSPDGTYTITAIPPSGARVVGVGTEAAVVTGGQLPTANPANTALMWMNSDSVSVPGQTRLVSRVVLSEMDGDNTREVFSAPGAGARWLGSDRLLISVRGDGRVTSLLVYSLAENTLTELGTWRELRGLDVSPGGRYVAFYLSWQAEPSANGVYLIDTLDGAGAVQLPWFGAWRWRDNDTLYYIPFEPGAAYHTLRLYDVATGVTETLATPETIPFTVANGYWEVSADGTRVLYQDARDNNVYVLEPVR